MQSVHKKVIAIYFLITLANLCGMGCRPQLIAGKYLVEAVDSPDRCLYFYGGTGRIEPKIVSIGWNDRYVIVKQKKEGCVFYYIIEHTKDYVYADVKDVVVGPLIEREFVDKLKQIGVYSNLHFTINYHF